VTRSNSASTKIEIRAAHLASGYLGSAFDNRREFTEFEWLGWIEDECPYKFASMAGVDFNEVEWQAGRLAARIVEDDNVRA
jgi:hypothetical protein